jgi:hypothetical protein
MTGPIHVTVWNEFRHEMDELTSEGVCNVLGTGGTDQRVLLHRPRSTARFALESYSRHK